MQTQITEARFTEIRQAQGRCSTYVIQDGNWVITQFYGKEIVSVWRKRNLVTDEVRFFEDQDEDAK